MSDSKQQTEPRKLSPEEAELAVKAIEDVEREEAKTQPQESESESD